MKNIIKRIKLANFLGYKHIYQRIRHPETSGSIEKKIVFVAGNQRSGTNMVMDTFEKSLITDVYHETDKRAFDNYFMRDKKTIHRLFSRSSAKVFIIKALLESQKLNSLLKEFAPAKAIWVYRNYDDVVNSMMVSFNNMAVQAARIAKNPKSSGWLGENMSEKTHALIREMVGDQIDDASASALQWYYRNVLFFEQNLHQNSNVSLIKYENLVSNPEQEFDQLFRFVGAEFDRKFVKTIFASSIKKKSPRKIKPEIKSICEDLMHKFESALIERKS